MAKKKLNKKVALLASVVFLFFALVAILAVLYFSRDPEKFLEDAELAMKNQNYESAEQSYHKARSLAESDDLRVEILFKLAELYQKTDKWDNVLGCWGTITRIEPGNVRARLAQLRYVYTAADSGTYFFWKQIESQTQEFLEIAQEDKLLEEPLSKWPCSPEMVEVDVEKLGPFLYMLSGRAKSEMTRLNQSSDPINTINEAINQLKKVTQLEPGIIDSYYYWAQAVITKKQVLASQGRTDQQEQLELEAVKVCQKGVDIAPDDPLAYVNLINIKLRVALDKQEDTEQHILALKSEFDALVSKFGSNAEVLYTTAYYYGRLGHKYLEQAVEYADKAADLTDQEPKYALLAVELHYRISTISKDKQHFEKAIDLADEALEYPSAQDEPGPRHAAARGYRVMLCSFLSRSYIEQILEPFDQQMAARKDEFLKKAEETVSEIEQLFASGQNPQVVKWHALLNLAEGNRTEALKSLYSAYKKFRASDSSEPFLSYILARQMVNSREVGVVGQFYANALNSGIVETHPDALLDFTDVLLQNGAYSPAISNLDMYEKNFEPNHRSRMLRIKSYIEARQFEQAQNCIDQFDTDDPNLIYLKYRLAQGRIMQIRNTLNMRQDRSALGQQVQNDANNVDTDILTTQLRDQWQESYKLVLELMEQAPELVSDNHITWLCSYYINEGQVGKAEDLIESAQKHLGDSSVVRFYSMMLEERDPSSVSDQRRSELEEKALAGIDDPQRRALNLGVFYNRAGQPAKAIEQLKKIVDTSGNPQKLESIEDFHRSAASLLLGLAIDDENWGLAEKVAVWAQLNNIDYCQGDFYEARLEAARQNYEQALNKINNCINTRPLFASAYLVRSNINSALERNDDAIKDAQQASFFNPVNEAIAHNLATVLYRRDQRLGNEITIEQKQETETAIIRALRANPNNNSLLGLYAEYISDIEPLRALAIRQNLQKANPSVINALLLGNLASRIADQQQNPQQSEVISDIALSAYKEARNIDPNDSRAVSSLAQFYRKTGLPEKAEKVLLGSGQRKLLWRHYLANAEYEKAENILDEMYAEKPNDPNTLIGLMNVAQQKGDAEDLLRYSNQLIDVKDTREYRLVQVQKLIKMNLLEDAEHKIQSLGERFPDESRTLLFRAWLTMKEGKLEDALKAVNQYLQTDEDSAIAWRLRGEISLITGEYAQAINDIRKSVSLENDPASRVSLGKAYIRAGRDAAAINELTAVMNQPQVAIQSRLLLEGIYRRLDRQQDLEQLYEEAVEKFGQSIFWLNRAGGFALQKGNFVEARRLYEKAWDIAEQNNDRGSLAKEALTRYFDTFVQSQDYDGVFEQCAKYTDGYFAPIAYVYMAKAELELGDKETAKEYCKKAINKTEADEEFTSGVLQEIYSLMGVEQVEEYCMEILRQKPDSIAANYAMYNLARLSNEFNKAIDYIDKCSGIVEQGSSSEYQFMLLKASTLQQAFEETSDKNYLTRAIDQYELIVKKLPDNPGAMNNLAYVLTKNDMRLNDALGFAKSAYELARNNPGVMDTYAYALYKNGKYDLAAEVIQAALERYQGLNDSVPVEVYEHAGMINEKLENYSEALSAYKEALKAGSDQMDQQQKTRINTAIDRVSAKKM